jgi:hypothetical protein
MDRTAIRFVLIVTVAVFARQRTWSHSKSRRPPVRIYSPNAGGEEAAVKRVVDGGPVPRAFWIGSAPASGANDRAFAITNLSAVHSLVPSA